MASSKKRKLTLETSRKNTEIIYSPFAESTFGNFGLSKYRVVDMDWSNLRIRKLEQKRCVFSSRKCHFHVTPFLQFDKFYYYSIQQMRFNRETQQMDTLFDRLFRRTTAMKSKPVQPCPRHSPRFSKKFLDLSKPCYVDFSDVREICQKWRKQIENEYRQKINKFIKIIGMKSKNTDYADVVGTISTFLTLSEEDEQKEERDWYDLFDVPNDEDFKKLYIGWCNELPNVHCQRRIVMARKLAIYGHIFCRYDAFSLFAGKFKRIFN